MGHSGDARLFGDPRGLADLQRGVNPPIHDFMPDGLAVAADEVNVLGRQPGRVDHHRLPGQSAGP